MAVFHLKRESVCVSDLSNFFSPLKGVIWSQFSNPYLYTISLFKRNVLSKSKSTKKGAPHISLQSLGHQIAVCHRALLANSIHHAFSHLHPILLKENPEITAVNRYDGNEAVKEQEKQHFGSDDQK